MINLTILFFLLQAPDTFNIIALRKLYYEAYENGENADQFLKLMTTAEGTSEPLILGYMGMSHIMNARFAYNPYTKLASFSKGKQLLERAVMLAPESLELRFLRFSVQTHAPKLLGYKSDIGADKAKIIKEWNNSADIDLRNRVKEFMLKSSYCTPNERSVFK